MRQGTRGWDTRRALGMLAVALAVAVALTLVAGAGDAKAGTYVAVQCDPEHSVNAPDAIFTRTSDHYTPGTACAGQGGGKLIRHDASTTKPGRWGAWSWYPPGGTVFTQITSQAHVGHDSGHKGNFTIIDGAGQVHYRWPREGVFDAVDWTAGTHATAFSAWLACHAAANGSCGASGAAHTYVRKLWFTLRDSSPPTLHLSGELLGGGQRRGTETLGVSSSDLGGGVWNLTVRVNGAVAATHRNPCDIIEGGAARRFTPCPGATNHTFAIDTEKAPFRQGANEVEVCSGDVGWPANHSCQSRTVHVDNGCPSSGTRAASALEASFAGAAKAKRSKKARRRAAPSNRRTAIRGRVHGAGAGARVCVFATPARPGEPEHLEGVASADGSGSFTYLTVRGPSRRLRLVFRHGNKAVERELGLRVAAAPRLKVGPRSRLRNGQVARFRGKLPGPWAGGRVVVLQARIGRRWLTFETARTGPGGRFTARYRFRETTSRTLYRFRAVVREQAGYPYAKGSSPVRRVLVTG